MSSDEPSVLDPGAPAEPDADEPDGGQPETGEPSGGSDRPLGRSADRSGATRSATPPDQVARAALARAQDAARTRGLRPGDKPRRTLSVPGPVSSAGPDARDPQPVGVTAGKLATELGWRPGLVEGDLRGRWPELVGADVAEHCRPETFDAGLLTLRASSTAWAASLTLLTPQLLRRLGEELGEGVVVEVRVVGPVGRGFGRGKRSVPGRGPRDTWG